MEDEKFTEKTKDGQGKVLIYDEIFLSYNNKMELVVTRTR